MFYDIYCDLCKKRELSPSKAAEVIGFNKGSVSVWKKKKSEGVESVPSTKILNMIADFFYCTIFIAKYFADNP